MPTCGRPGFVAQALRCFLRRTYRNAELIVVDDGRRPVRALCQNTPGVRYIRLPYCASTGEKLNIGIEAARGEIIHKIDDDDYYAPSFLATSGAHLPRSGSRTVVARCCYLILSRGSSVVRFSGCGWTAGGTLCFRRDLWRRRPFRDEYRSVDSLFLRDHHPRMVRICAPEEYMMVRHGRNTWQAVRAYGERQPVDEFFAARPEYGKPLSRLVPRIDLGFYRSLDIDAARRRSRGPAALR